MGHAPKCIVTDQDPSMRIAIEKVLPNTRHRYCMWHIMSKLTEKVGPLLSSNEEFLSKINSVVWSHYLSPEDFEKERMQVIVEYDLVSHTWLSHMFSIRRYWIPGFFRDLFMAGLLRTTSRSESENNFFGEFTNPGFSLVEFFMQFESAMDSQRHNNSKLNHISDSCTPVHSTPLPIEKHASSVYTLSIFYEIQKEICAACFACPVVSVQEVNGERQYVINDERGMVFNVVHSLIASTTTCSCKDFDRVGLVCRHMFVVFKDLKLHTIPADFVLSRWCKNNLIKPIFDIGDSVFDQCVANEERKLQVNRLWSDIHCCVAIIEDNPVLFDQFSQAIKEQKNFLLSSQQGSAHLTTKASVIERFCGSAAPADVTVLPPQQARNKGCGKRLKGGKEVAIQSKKKLRLCRTCNEMCNHDSRNCPMNKSA
ncbi:unnamed protein product [Cuscuta epithymum]|uniref:SWIM-type domain-containing protein n=1 Tax=Cuscuta epithymum TaxID=186058 RepID=A0AAV0C966_9ASTE|nr:unnamed protein product [Cuscuta epithymum]